MELWLTAHNSEKNFNLVRGMQLRIADRTGLEHFPFIVLDFNKRLAFFSNTPEGKCIATNVLQEIALLPSRKAVYIYVSQLD